MTKKVLSVSPVLMDFLLGLWILSVNCLSGSKFHDFLLIRKGSTEKVLVHSDPDLKREAWKIHFLCALGRESRVVVWPGIDEGGEGGRSHERQYRYGLSFDSFFPSFSFAQSLPDDLQITAYNDLLKCISV